MIKELVEYGARKTLGEERALTKVAISFDLVINNKGEFIKFIPYSDEKPGEKPEIYAEWLMSKKGKACLLLDKQEEVLCIGADAQKKHQLFIAKLHEYDHLPALKPVLLFYDKNNLKGLPLAQKDYNNLEKKYKKNGAQITFMVGSDRLLNSEEIKKEIIKKFQEDEEAKRNGRFCSICGKNDYPVVDEPHGLVKMPMGQSSGSALVSFNANAFESYGLKGNDNSGICRKCARNYVDALKILLSEGHKTVGDDGKEHYHYLNRFNLSNSTVALYWTKEEIEEDITECILYPNAAYIEKMFKSVYSGTPFRSSLINENMYYSITLSSAAARITMRDWTAMSLRQYKQHLAEWFKDIEIYDKQEPVFPSLKKLIDATQREKKNEKTGKTEIIDDASRNKLGSVLWQAAIKGRNHKIPISVLNRVLHRVLLGDSFDAKKAALIKMIINRNKNIEMKSSLDETNTSVAYLCGRLFAVIETMQWMAMGKGKLNSGIKERLFAASANQPARIFGMLLTRNVPIYQRKINGYLAKDLQSIVSQISKLPLRFSTIEKGEYALGYYFQKKTASPKNKDSENDNTNEQ